MPTTPVQTKDDLMVDMRIKPVFGRIFNLLQAQRMGYKAVSVFVASKDEKVLDNYNLQQMIIAVARDWYEAEQQESEDNFETSLSKDEIQSRIDSNTNNYFEGTIKKAIGRVLTKFT